MSARLRQTGAEPQAEDHRRVLAVLTFLRPNSRLPCPPHLASVAIAHRVGSHVEVGVELGSDLGRRSTEAMAARMWPSQASRSAGPMANGA